MLLALMLLAGVAGVAYVRQANEPAGTKMANAAEKLLASLTAEQKSKATFDFDDKERFNWDFVPLQDSQKKSTRKGLPLESMTAEQKVAARSLLAAGTSSDGYAKATTIMSLESILSELEKGGNMVRNPEWYFFTIFGTPSKTGKWGWRVEGHHLSLNFAVDGGKIVAATPAFFGANPATVMQGPRKGTRTLMEADDLAKELFQTLNDDQKKIAFQQQNFPEIQSHTLQPKPEEPKGLAASKMTASQRGILLKLLQAYANRMPADVAEADMSEVHKAGLDQIHFAYSGGVEPGKGHTYRVQGPTFVIQFLNVQADSAKNPANHIHSVWRNTKGDFGTKR
jgi:hypothetical protein